MDCRQIPVAEVEQIERHMRRCLDKWRSHPDFEELLSMTRLHFWTMASQIEPDEWRERSRMLRHVCRQIAFTFMTHPANRLRTHTGKGNPLPLRDGNLDPGWDSEPSRERRVKSDSWTRRAVPDFAPTLIERLWRREVWEGVFSLLTEEEQDRVWQWVSGQEPLGRDRATEYARLHRMLNRYRRQVGEPLRCGGGNGGLRRTLSDDPRAVRAREQYWSNVEHSRQMKRAAARRRKHHGMAATEIPP